jgi:hypothetical protein
MRHGLPALAGGLALIAGSSLAILAGGASAALPRTVSSTSTISSPPTLSSTQLSYLSTAEYGVQKTSKWWSPKYHWYLEELRDPHKYPQASIWDTIPLFEATDEIAIAQPTAAHLSAVNSFATHSEDYWNKHLRPHPGYAPYPGDNSAKQQTWYDDNGWLGLGFLDADVALGSNRYLSQAERAFGFIAAGGWDRKAGGGMWWNTYHPFRSGEALAADTYLAARLYSVTKNRTYLAAAEKYISWAESHLKVWNGIFSKRGKGWVQMPHDGEGTMVSAFVTLGQATGVKSWYTKAESLGLADVKWLGPFNNGPQYEAILVRGMLSLYAYDHNARWYKFAKGQAERITAHARTAPGVYLHNWNGSKKVPGSVANMLRTDAASISVFADLATVVPPK